jgi:hypothetical protein
MTQSSNAIASNRMSQERVAEAVLNMKVARFTFGKTASETE